MYPDKGNEQHASRRSCLEQQAEELSQSVMLCLQEPVKKGKTAAKRKVPIESDSDDDFVVEIEDDSDDGEAEDADFIDDDDDDDKKAPKASKKQKTASGKAAPVKRVPTPKAKAAPAKVAAPVPAAAPTPSRHAPIPILGLQFHLGQTLLWGSADLYISGLLILKSNSAHTCIQFVTASPTWMFCMPPKVYLEQEMSSAGRKAGVRLPARTRNQKWRLMCKQPSTPLTEQSSYCRRRRRSTSRCSSSRREGAGISEQMMRPHKILGPRLLPAHISVRPRVESSQC